MKTSTEYRRLERVLKGAASHRRLQILDLLHEHPELSVIDIAERLKMGYENASDHVRKMTSTGLLMKRNDGPAVRHKLTARAESILVFCKTLQ